MLAALQAEGLQSDARFTEAYVRHRSERGYGPLRIRQELRERGIAAELIDLHLYDPGAEWELRLAELRRRKFGASRPADYREQARQSRFLFQRGFSTEQIRRLFRTGD